MRKLPWMFWVPWITGVFGSQGLFALALHRCGPDPVVVICEMVVVAGWSGMLWKTLWNERAATPSR